ncbi:MAG TPA: hypothetical protein PKC66_16510, partial [Leptospiraceae bacterium]|nr:hypothetical protein [Leptospiraceae bacterium]
MKTLNKFLFLLSIFFFSCISKEYRLIGITSRMEEVFYYGNDFKVTAWEVDQERLDKIKLDLKNSIALENPSNAKDRWREVSELSLKDGNYILFQILPDTKVPTDFLKFSFQWNGNQSTKTYSYYSEILETNIRGRYYYPIGGFYGGGGGFMYPTNSRQTEQITQRLYHIYNFLLF